MAGLFWLILQLSKHVRISNHIYMYMLYNYIYIFIFIWWTYFIKLIIYNMHIICICLSFAPWFSSPTGTCWDIWGRIWGPHFRCRGHTGHSPAPLHHTRQRFFCFYHQSRRASFCWEKKTQTYGKIEGKHGKQIWKKLEKELNLWTIKVMTPTSRPFPRAQALASEIKKEPPSRDQLPIRRSLTGTDLTKSHLVLNLAPTYSWLVVLTILQMVYIIWSIYLVNNG